MPKTRYATATLGIPGLAIVALALLVVPTGAQAQDEYAYEEDVMPMFPGQFPADARRPRLVVFGHFGFAGEVDAAAAAAEEQSGSSTKLDPSLGAMLRMTFPLHPLFAVGLQTGGVFWRSGGGDFNPIADFDGVFKFRFPYKLRAQKSGEIYLAMPVGFSLGFLDDSSLVDFDPGLGWNIGVLGGGQIFFGRRVGMMFELGWMRHAIERQDFSVKTNEGGRGEIDYAFNQFVMHTGFVFLLGQRR